ncbi:MAG: hypothetical protein SGJ19_13315 [Planctomycetia bacterium]|nr:hypothetical protein [Planctomycetia bacterium]
MDDLGSLRVFESVTSVSIQHAAADCGETLAEFAALEEVSFDVDSLNDEDFRVLYATQVRLPKVFVIAQGQPQRMNKANLEELQGLQAHLRLTDPRRPRRK